MDAPDCLAHYPSVVVRIACRNGSYRLTQLAAKHGPETTPREVLGSSQNLFQNAL